jgi:hypothetical protein
MGYRSDVAIVFAFADTLIRDAFITQIEDDPALQYFSKEFESTDEYELPAVRFYATDVKWYESYPDVQAVEHLCTKATDIGGAWVKVRIGEDDDDTETDNDCYDQLSDRFHYYDYVRVSRRIEF